LFGCFFRSHKQRSDIHIKSDISKSGSNDPGPPIVTILSEFDDQYSGSSSFPVFKFPAQSLGFLIIVVLLHLMSVNLLNESVFCFISAKILIQSGRDLAWSRPGSGSIQ